MKFIILSLLISSLQLIAKEYNKTINWIWQSMPQHGNYSTSDKAFEAFDKAINYNSNGLSVYPRLAKPSFCSSATYLVFLQTILTASTRNEISLDASEWQSFDYTDQKDGEGIWGRWNSNGPGVAKLFADLKIGKNFESYEKAKTGDFMKIFWSENIGRSEHGHLVIYQSHDAETVTFWSSNKPKGYGLKTVSRNKVKWAIFSRLHKIKNLKKISNLPLKDPFLADMLIRDFSREEVRKICKIK